MPKEKDLTDKKYSISQLKTHEMCDSILVCCLIDI